MSFLQLGERRIVCLCMKKTPLGRFLLMAHTYAFSRLVHISESFSFLLPLD